jgi:protein-S-isoprenylcysteine O-methyltransferase Ste14
MKTMHLPQLLQDQIPLWYQLHMNDLVAIIALMFWPVIPLFWIPIHSGVHFFRRIGLAAYLLPVFTWLPLTFFIYRNRGFLLHFKITLPFPCTIVGWVLLVLGTLLHIWTARLLGLWGIIGVPEISGRVKKELAAGGPFSIVRHPTYLAHTLIFSGAFLITGVLTVGMVALLDFIIVNSVIIPLEEKELAGRFGDEYVFYKKKVPSKFFPSFFKR